MIRIWPGCTPTRTASGCAPTWCQARTGPRPSTAPPRTCPLLPTGRCSPCCARSADVIVVGAATVRSRALQAGRAGAVARPAVRPDADPADRGDHRAARPRPGQPSDHRGPAGRPHDRHHHREGPAGHPGPIEPHADVIVAGEETVDLKAAVSALAERGHRRMLAEGGPHLLAQLLQAGLLDELCLTIGPLMAGPGAGRIVAGAPDGPASAAAAEPGSCPGRRRFPALPVHQERPLIRTGRGACPGEVRGAAAGRARTRSPRRRRGR